MTNRKKSMLLMFVDYLICVLVQVVALLFLSWLLKYDWGFLVYSVLMCLVVFGFIYSRAHKAAKKDLLHKDTKNMYTEGLLLALPLAVFHLLVIGIYAAFLYRIIPFADAVVNITYSFPDNLPRVKTMIRVIDYVTPVVRLWFGSVIGFMGDKTSVGALLLVPLVNLLGGMAGYFAGAKKFFISEKVFKVQNKIKDKFNE